MSQDVTHSDERRVKTNGIELAYDTVGDPSGRPLLLIGGLGQQLIDWPLEFCTLLVGRGFWVIRFDNRDAGLSTHLDEAGVPDVFALVGALAQGEFVKVPYSLRDMADDTTGLLDALGIEQVGVFGVSMGGMIAQMLTVSRPQRVSCLVSVISTTGDPSLPPPTPEAAQFLMAPTPTDREGYIEKYIQEDRMLAGPAFPVNEEWARKHGGERFDRGLNSAGWVRQLVAILASGSRRESLKSVKVPALVVHGDSDPLLPLECGEDTANSIPGAELMVIEGMGHQFPPEIWPRVIDAIVRLTTWESSRNNFAF